MWDSTSGRYDPIGSSRMKGTQRMPMTKRQPVRLLTINTGSSSIKAALYRIAETERRDLAIQIERIGHHDSHIQITDTNGTSLLDEQRDVPDDNAALDALFVWLREHQETYQFDAVGHRVVHGGPRYREPVRVTAELLAALQQWAAIDPDHLPQALRAIDAVSRAYPEMPQVACFDTAFHRQMPRVAQRYALPQRYADAGVIRYGFHGLSYEFIMQSLRATDRAAAEGRVIIAHLGNGASMVAVARGVGVETTMGFSPTGGLVMSTRTGDLDPSVPLFLIQSQGLKPEDVSALVNKRAGMRAVSETSGDMRDLLAKESSDPRAAEAVELFCYHAKKSLGALAAVLGGLETLVFTGGIGERAAPVRARICAGMAFLGIHLDADRNAAHSPIISPDDSPVTVRVMETDEDLMIARHTDDLLA